MIKYIFSVVITCLIAFESFSQNYQSDYLEAKRLFNNKEYRVAKDAFRSLIVSAAKHNFGEYASFFYGLSAYNLESYSEAKDMWLQVRSKYPDWNQNDELQWWLSATYFKLGDYQKGSEYLAGVRGNRLEKEGEGLKIAYLSALDSLSDIVKLHENFENDELLSEYLLSELVKQNKLYEYEEVAKRIIKQLKLKEENYYSNHYDVVMKDEYNVAVLFPFDFDSLEGAGRVARNRVIMDMYEGIKFAADELNSSGRKINLYPYDTKGNRSSLHETGKILAKEELLGMDLIIGPRYRQPFNMVFEFSKQNKINMINPWSSNSQVTGDNLFSFLLNPSEKTQALKLAEYAIGNFENKNAFVFYSSRDSILAATYKNKLEESGFNVPVFNEVNQENLGKQSDILIDFKEVLVRSRSEEDSLRQLGHVAFTEKRKGGKKVPYAEVLNIPKDSIGHIFVCSGSNLAAANFISAIIERPDTIPLIGKSEWLNVTMITYNQMEDTNLSVVAPLFMSPDSQEYLDLRSAMMDYYKTLPSNNHYIGYEMMNMLGGMMHQYGKYFQEGFKRDGFQEGKLTRGFDYNGERSNQILPIVKVMESKFIDINNQEK